MDLTEKLSTKCVKFITNSLEKDEEELEKVNYGLQVIFVNFFKLTILFLFAFVLGIMRYTFIAFISFALLRTFAAGVHADSNLKCTITNIVLFIGNVYLSTILVLNNTAIIILFSLSLLLIVIYAPADTEDRPLPSKKLRRRLKVNCVAITIILAAIDISIISGVYRHIVVISVLEEALLITPAAYMLFRKKYKNFEKIEL